MTKKDLKIVFFGTPDFAVESLDRLISEGYDIAAVVTATDKPAGRGHHMLHSAVKQYAVSHGLRVLQPVSLKAPEFIAELQAIGADLFIVIAFRMLPEAVWRMPRLGTFNLHGSLLPKYRGAAPINWAVINGEKETGVTTFFLKHEIDTGDIIDRRSITIGDDEDAGSVYDRLMHIGAELTSQTVARIIDGSLTTMPQDSAGMGDPTPAPKIFKETCRIDWSKSAQAVHNLVRGLSPWPGAWTTLAAGGDSPVSDVKIFATSLTGSRTTDAPAGTLIAAKDSLSVACGDGRTLTVVQLQPAGKKRMTSGEYLRGARLEDRRFE